MGSTEYETSRLCGWYVTRDQHGGVRLREKWWPSQMEYEIEWCADKRDPKRDENRGSLRDTLANVGMFFTQRLSCGDRSAGSRQLAALILVRRFDPPVVPEFCDQFYVDWILPMRLPRGHCRFISKEDVTLWWALKRDQAAGDLDMPEIHSTYGAGKHTRPMRGLQYERSA